MADPASTANRLAAALRRHDTIIKLISLAAILLCVLLILRRLPLEYGIDALGHWVDGLGIWGPIVFALIYVAGVILLAPGSTFTLAAGAIFGLTIGTITASAASTTGAALAFLISRYLARDAITGRLQHYPRFRAIDRAVSDKGWKIVALLRLSPAVPFNLQNYLYGLTGIRFRTYIFTSCLAMLPGTFLYVYLGHAGRAGLEAAAGERSRTPAEWIMLAVGLAATLAVTIYTARLARGALRQAADISGTEITASEQKAPAGRWPWSAIISMAIAFICIGVCAFIQFNVAAVRSWFGH